MNAALQPLGDRQDCRFAWAATDAGYTIELDTEHEFHLQKLPDAPSYLVFYTGEGELFFVCPLVNRPVRSAFLVV
jgi:hypothetical protein